MSHSFLYFSVLRLPRHHSRISIAESQTCLQVLGLHSAYNTVHAFSVLAQKIYFQSLIPQTLPTSERGRRCNIAFITKILQKCWRKNGIVNIFLPRKFSKA